MCISLHKIKIFSMAQTRIREDIRVLIYACTAYYRQGRHVIQLPTRPAVSPLRLVLVSLWGNRTILTLNQVLGCTTWTNLWPFLKILYFSTGFPTECWFWEATKEHGLWGCRRLVRCWVDVLWNVLTVYIQWCPRTSTTWSQRTDVTSGSPSTMTRPSSTAYTSKPR